MILVLAVREKNIKIAVANSIYNKKKFGARKEKLTQKEKSKKILFSFYYTTFYLISTI